MRKEIPTILINAFKEGKVILFIGSGLSISGKSGYFSSSQFSEFLLSQTITESGNGIELGKFIIDKTNLQLDDIAEYFEIFTSKQDLLEIIKKKFNNPTIPAFPVHKEIWELPNIKHIYTTNFDPLIEKGLSASKIRAQPMVITDPDKFIDTSTNDYCVFKIHGCAVKSNERNDFVITKSDYMDFEIRHPLRKLEAQNKLIHNVFLFMGYSLNDSNFQSMYREIRRFSNSNSPSCFAVLNDVSPAKIAFWKGLGINIIQADALDIIRGIKNHSNLKLHSSWFEWRSKEGAREEDKQAIAQKTLDFIINEIKIEPESSPKCLNLILDSGTSILTFAKRIKNLLDNIDASNGIFEDISCINIVTNCAAIIDTLRWVHLVEKKSSYPIINLYIIGGKLRTETQAITITKNTDNEDLAETNVKTILSLIDDNSPRIGILGATTVSLEGFKTNSIDEVSTKRALIECSDTIIFMVDHSKFRIGGSNVFLSLQEAKILSEIKKKIYIFTDRPLDEITSSAFMTNNIKIELIS